MRIEIDPSALKKTRWYEFAVRFLFGGLITAATGIIAKKWGPAVGGLFLAFPAIFPASATLIEKHEKQKKQRAGMEGAVRGRKAASVDAAGASMGAIGVLGFAIVVWRLLPVHATWEVLIGASIIWFAAAVTAWEVREHI